MKKGYILAQPFVIILALILMALVVLFGGRAVSLIKKTADIAELNKFILNLDNQVELMYNYNVGSTKEISLNVPLSIEQICFSNPGEPLSKNVNDNFLRTILENDKLNNVFILPLNKFKDFDYRIDNLRVPNRENPLCVNTRGKLDAVMETVLVENKVFVEIRK